MLLEPPSKLSWWWQRNQEAETALTVEVVAVLLQSFKSKKLKYFFKISTPTIATITVAALEWWRITIYAWKFLDLNDSNSTAKASETTAVAFT